MDKDTLPQHNRTANHPDAEGSATPDTVSARRRKLIRASAAVVPAIMTLRSGSAAAVASIHGCIERDALMARATLGEEDQVYGDDLAAEPTHDQWARVLGKACMLVTINRANGGIDQLYCIRNSKTVADWYSYDNWNLYDTNGSQINNNSFKSKWDAAERVIYYSVHDIGGWKHINLYGQDMSPTPPIKVSDLEKGRDVYLLMYVASHDGEILGGTYYPRVQALGDQVASPITDSCLCSVDPNGNIILG